MAIARSGTAVLSNSGGTATTSCTASLASTTPGDYNIIVVSANTSGATSPDPAQTCTGGSGSWTALATSEKTGSPSHRITAFGKVFVSGDPNPTVTIASTGNIECGSAAYSGVDPTTPVVSGESGARAQSTSSTSFATPSITTAASRWLISAAGDRTSGTTWTGTDSLLVTGAVASSANVILQDSNGLVAAGTYSRTLTASAATSVGNALIFALNPAASGGTAATASASLTLTAGATAGTTASASASVSLTGTAASPGTAATAAVALSGSGAAGAAGGASAALTLTGSAATPAQLWVTQHAGGTQYVAHRNGFYATYGEETLEGYTAAANYHTWLALEISVWDTSDGVYVCSHDQTTSRVFSGTNYTITSTTWATLSPNGTSTVGRPTTIIGGNPMRRLEEILDAFPNRIFVIENKHGTNEATLAALLDTHAKGRWMFKGPYNDTANANTAATHGAPMWLYFYPSQLSSLSTTYSAVSSSGVPIIFGLGDYSTAPVPVQTDSDTFFGFTSGKPIYTWAHIIGTTTQRSTADSQATTDSAVFDGYMLSAVSSVIASNATQAATAAGALTLTASGGSTAGAAATGALSLTDSGNLVAKAVGSAALTFTASGVAGSTGAGGLTLTSSAAAVGPASASASVGLTGSGSGGTSANGQVTFTASANAGTAGAGTASLTFTATGSAGTAATATGALGLTGTAAIGNNAGGQIIFTSTGAGTGRGGGSASLTFTASATTGGTASGGTASLGLTGTVTASFGAAGTLTATATASPAAPATVGASLNLAATAPGTGSSTAAGSITFTTSGGAASPAAATATLALTGVLTPPSIATASAAIALTAAGQTVYFTSPVHAGPAALTWAPGPAFTYKATPGPALAEETG